MPRCPVGLYGVGESEIDDRKPVNEDDIRRAVTTMAQDFARELVGPAVREALRKTVGEDRLTMATTKSPPPPPTETPEQIAMLSAMEQVRRLAVARADVVGAGGAARRDPRAA